MSGPSDCPGADPSTWERLPAACPTCGAHTARRVAAGESTGAPRESEREQAAQHCDELAAYYKADGRLDLAGIAAACACNIRRNEPIAQPPPRPCDTCVLARECAAGMPELQGRVLYRAPGHDSSRAGDSPHHDVPAPQGPVSSPVPDGAHPAALGADCGTSPPPGHAPGQLRAAGSHAATADCGTSAAALVARAREWLGQQPITPRHRAAEHLVARLADALERETKHGKTLVALRETSDATVRETIEARDQAREWWRQAKAEAVAALARAEQAEARVAALEGVAEALRRARARGVLYLSGYDEDVVALRCALDATAAPAREPGAATTERVALARVERAARERCLELRDYSGAELSITERSLLSAVAALDAAREGR